MIVLTTTMMIVLSTTMMIMLPTTMMIMLPTMMTIVLPTMMMIAPQMEKNAGRKISNSFHLKVIRQRSVVVM